MSRRFSFVAMLVLSGLATAACSGSVDFSFGGQTPAEAAVDQPQWLVLSRFLRAAVADRRAAWDASWLECPWLPAAWEACERFDREEADRHAALRHAAAAVVDQPHASASVALRRVSAGSMVFLSVPD